MNGLFRPEWSTLKKLMFLQSMGGETWSTISGNPVSFTARNAPLKQLSVAFSPVQSLNGYDSPWPAGGGKNLLDYDTVYASFKNGENHFTGDSGTIAGVRTYIKPEWIGKEFTFSAFVDLSDDATPTGYYVVALAGGVAISGNRVEHNTKGYSSVTFTPTSTDDYVVFSWGSGYGTIDISDIQLELGASRTAWTPYANECPILGWDSLNVEMRGKNLADQSAMTHTGVGNDNGRLITSTQRLFTPNAPCKAGSLLYVKVVGESSQSEVIFVNRIIFFDKDGVFVQRGQISGTAPRVEGYINVPDNCQYFSVDLRTDALTTDISVSDVSQLMVAISNYVPVPYVPYNPLSRSISISLGSTVYSGTVDVLTGVVMVTHFGVDLGTQNWTKWSVEYPYFYTVVSPAYKYLAAQTNFICSQYAHASIGSSGSTVGIYITDASNVRIRDLNYLDADAATFKTAMSGVQLVYELATPQTIQLTPQEVESLAGDNTLFSDANGDLTVEYRSN